MQPPSPVSTPQPLPQTADQRLEQAQMQEVLFLFKTLLDREQGTVKAILVCLLEVGAIHFVNDRVQFKPLRPVARPLIKLSKPALVFFAHRWVQKNCPQLVTQWLGGKVRSTVKRKTPPPTAPSVVVEPTLLYQREIRRLRSRVQVTTGALVGVSGVLVLILMGVDFSILNPLSQPVVTGQQTIKETIGASSPSANIPERQN